MSEVKWIKVLTDIFEDEKIRLIQSMPEGDALIVLWLKLLTQAGKSNRGGCLCMNEQTPYTPEMLSVIFGKSIQIINLALNTFEQFGMIESTEKGIFINNWEKHQNIEGLDKIREQTRLRVAAHRERQKLLVECNVTGNATITQSNETDIDKELDKEKENIIILSPDEQKIFNILGTVANYPIDRKSDLDMIKRLKERYPQLDLVESINDWAAYKLDKPLRAKDNPRSQINTSCKNYVKWGKNIKQQQAAQSNKKVFR